MTATRSHPRFAVEVDADVKFEGQRLPARTKDVSRGGLCFVSRGAVAVGQIVQVSLALVFDEATFSEPLDLRARVVWCTGLAEDRFQVGTTFVNMTTEMRSYLEMFLRYLNDGLAKQRGEPVDEDEELFGS